ncbi:MAG: AIM24 family protein [bacterium]|nr:AIM24 family protein [bacterium]
MFQIQNFLDNDDVRIVEEAGCFKIAEYQRDLSCSPQDAQLKYFMASMRVRKKQLYIDLSQNQSGVIIQPGAMQWMIGEVQQTTGLKGVGDAVGKFFSSKVTGESTIKPEYKGKGILVTEPTYLHYLIEKVEDWGGGIVMQDGLFAACDGSVRLKTVARTTLSSTVAGGEGLFNLCATGSGHVVFESKVPREELILLQLDNDIVKIDGSYAIAWTSSLQFTVERSGKTLLGSAASGEGLVNVYKGSGKILMMPQV